MQERDTIIMGSLEQVTKFFESQARQLKDTGAPVEITGPHNKFDLYIYFRVMQAGEHDWLRSARIETVEQPNGCVRVWFQLRYFPDHDLFWRVADVLIRKMEQQGFQVPQPTTTVREGAGASAAEQAQVEPVTPIEDSTDNDIVLESHIDPNDLRKKAEIMQRREEVKRLFRKGLSAHAIALRVRYSESTVKRDLKVLGLTKK